MITPDVRPVERDKQRALLIDLDGLARSGKGTTAGAVQDWLKERNLSSRPIIQGWKFRTFTEYGLAEGLNFEDREQIAKFLRSPTNKQDFYDRLGQFARMQVSEADAILYAPAISDNVAIFGSVEEAHEIALDFMYNEAADAAEENVDVILLDGRVLGRHAKLMERGGRWGRHALSIYLECTPLVAAHRDLARRDETYRGKDFNDLSDDQKLTVIMLSVKIDERNNGDMQRAVEPLVPPVESYNLDVIRFDATDPEEVRGGVNRALKHRAIRVNTTLTDHPKQMVVPVSAVVGGLIQHELTSTV